MDMATVMVMATEDIMQSNTVNSRDGEIEIDLLQLLLDILLNRPFVLPYRIYVISTAPKMPIPILILQIRMPIKYHQTALTFQIPHKL